MVASEVFLQRAKKSTYGKDFRQSLTLDISQNQLPRHRSRFDRREHDGYESEPKNCAEILMKIEAELTLVSKPSVRTASA